MQRMTARLLASKLSLIVELATDVPVSQLLLYTYVVYFDQLSGVAHTQKLVETLLGRFQPYLFISNDFQ